MTASGQAPPPRLRLARSDLAAASLEGIVAAERYQPTTPMRITASVAPVWREPDPTSERLDELILGEVFEALASACGFVWGQAARDGYVGFVAAETLGPLGAAPTHRVAAIRTYAFAEPSIKAAASGPYSLGALVAIEAEQGPFSRSADDVWFWSAHLAPVGVFERDAAAIAERFLGAPYLWGGRTSVGLDCSGLVHQALYACGRALPRDADMQLAAARQIARADARRGDLVGWIGHIGLLMDETRLIHANSHHMAVAIEPLDEAIARMEAAGRGPTVFRRL
jgi:hypothetical protein